ncbi:MAG: single-stranded-DNA-specific exonuclease RecJ [bacterium]|nr:single-stranded-DNA-specific exonuclease RecJ [bacterium]
MKNYIWEMYEANIELQRELSDKLGIMPNTSQILINRGIKDIPAAESFLYTAISALSDPFLLPDVETSVKRILKTIKHRERITIYGDYDADGITSTALLYRFLKDFGADIDFYIPNRMNEGYGLNTNIIKDLCKKGTKLIITVDCGTNSIEEVKAAISMGTDVIITDHHTVEIPMPQKYPVVNPKRADSKYPFSELAGIGVVFQLCRAVAKHLLGDISSEGILKYADLAAIGTVADVVPLLGDNRIIVKLGISKLRTSENIGLKTLIKESGLKQNKISSGQVAFMIAPRLNAAGRMQSAVESVTLLTTDSQEAASDKAKLLCAENINRQETEKEVLASAVEMVKSSIDLDNEPVIVLESDEWHEGVIGIVASRLVDMFHRPAILICTQKKEAKGSGRSISGFKLIDALRECKDCLIRFGGHSYAAGVTINKDNIKNFRNKINWIAARLITKEHLQPKMRIDLALSPSNITNKFLAEIEHLEPYGMGNSKPVFIAKGLELGFSPRKVGADHIKLTLSQQGKQFEAIGFRMADYMDNYRSQNHIDIIYTPQINIWQGRKSLQLNLKDMRFRT